MTTTPGDKLFLEYINRFPKRLITALQATPQDPTYHPEGSVYNHIRLVFEAAGDDVDLQITALFHDLGKIDCTFFHPEKRRYVAYGHEFKAEKYIDQYKQLFTDVVVNWDKVKFICENHMKAHNIGVMKSSKVETLKASPYFEDLMLFAKYDNMVKK